VERRMRATKTREGVGIPPSDIGVRLKALSRAYPAGERRGEMSFN